MKAICVTRESDYAEEGDVRELVGFVHRMYQLRAVLVDAGGAFFDDQAENWRLLPDDDEQSE